MDSHDNALSEFAAPSPAKVFVGSGCLVHDGHGRYLLVRETKAVANGKLSLPAGKLEPDESISDAAIRETFEETGLQVSLDGLLCIFHSPRTTEGMFGVSFVFAAAVVGGTPTPTEEHPFHVWLTRAEIATLAEMGELRGRHPVEAVDLFEADATLPADVITVVEA